MGKGAYYLSQQLNKVCDKMDIGSVNVSVRNKEARAEKNNSIEVL